jgi:phosphoribosyl 1,2-cyclic phosphodiesterase
MSVYFQSHRSSSAGNCLALWTSTSSILIDCGVKVQRECRQILDTHLHRAGQLDAVVVSHAHGDHMAYGSLRVLGQEGIPVVAPGRISRQLRLYHEPDAWKEPPRLRAFSGDTCAVGDFHLIAFPVPHAPGYPTFAFHITAHDGRSTRRIVVCTDLHDYASIVPAFVDADFIFVEANHDLELLREYFNPASLYHLNNSKTASLLLAAARTSGTPPKAVMLGHLSEERNRRTLAIEEVVRRFGQRETRMRFHLDAAPARRESEIVEI